MALLWACAVHVAGLGSGNVVLPPPAATPKSATPVAVVLLQGAQIDASAYTPLLQSIQAAAVSSSGGGEPLAVWAAAPQVTGSIVNPVTIGGSISQAISLLSAAGMPNGTALFLAGCVPSSTLVPALRPIPKLDPLYLQLTGVVYFTLGGWVVDGMGDVATRLVVQC